MVRNAKDLYGSKIEATDGEIGKVHDFLFDDSEWIVRYMVADTGKWLSERLVLISPFALGKAAWEDRKFPVKLTRKEIEDSPSIDSALPVSRKHESDLAKHYNWPTYWTGGGILAAPATMTYPTVVAATATQPALSPDTQEAIGRDAETDPERDPHLQSMRDVEGSAIHAEDGDIGHVSDFILDDDNWTVRYIEVDTGGLLPGKHVLIAPAWVRDVDWEQHAVHVKLSKEQIKTAPEYHKEDPIDRLYEETLYKHYGVEAYWQAPEPATQR